MKWPTRTDRPTVSGIALVALLAAWGPVPAQSPEKSYAPYPAPDAGYITDLAGLLPASDEERLENLLYDLEKKTGVEMVVVTIGSIDDYPGTGADTIEKLEAPRNARPTDRFCPLCEEKLLCSFKYPQTSATVDVCRECHGIWLDRGEMGRIVRKRTKLRRQGKLDPYGVPGTAKASILEFIDKAIESLT